MARPPGLARSLWSIVYVMFFSVPALTSPRRKSMVRSSSTTSRISVPEIIVFDDGAISFGMYSMTLRVFVSFCALIVMSICVRSLKVCFLSCGDRVRPCCVACQGVVLAKLSISCVGSLSMTRTICLFRRGSLRGCWEVLGGRGRRCLPLSVRGDIITSFILREKVARLRVSMLSSRGTRLSSWILSLS